MANIETLLSIRERLEDNDERCECGCLTITRTAIENDKELLIKLCSNNECDFYTKPIQIIQHKVNQYV